MADSGDLIKWLQIHKTMMSISYFEKAICNLCENSVKHWVF